MVLQVRGDSNCIDCVCVYAGNCVLLQLVGIDSMDRHERILIVTDTFVH